MSKIKVGLLYGGRSGEHEVSVRSAASVMEAMDKEKYNVYPIAITKSGRWLPGLSPLELVAKNMLEVKETYASDVIVSSTVSGKTILPVLDELQVVFPVLHGPYGEDGTIQGLLELAGVAYVGGGVLASAVGMDKALMKQVFQINNIPVGKYLVFLRSEWEKNPDKIMETICRELNFPCFVKPANLGSSVGISKAHNIEELHRAMDTAALYDRKLVVEAYIKGREIECSVLGNEEPQASVPGEIIPCAEFYDYEAKYIAGDSRLVIPADLPDNVVQNVRNMAIRAFKAIDCAGMARVDFFVCDDEQVLVNEINTIPGFTSISMYPKLWEATGLPYSKLIDKLIDLAIERKEDKDRNRIS